LISLLGGSASAALDAAISGGPIEIPDTPDVHKVIEAGACKLTKKCRELIYSRIGAPDFSEIDRWMAKFFNRLDSMLIEMESETPQQIGGRFLQLNMEITRRWK